MPSQVKIDLFEIEQIPHVRVAIFTGQVDESNLEQVKTKLDPLILEDSVTYIILNFAQLTFINSKVIGYLTGLYSRLSESGKNSCSSSATNQFSTSSISSASPKSFRITQRSKKLLSSSKAMPNRRIEKLIIED